MKDLLTFDAPVNKALEYSPSQANNKNDNDRPIYLQVDGVTFAKLMGDYTSAEGGSRIRKFERGLA